MADIMNTSNKYSERKKYMTFLELAKERYSVRSFSQEPIAPEKLNAVIEAGHAAPTACNNQPQKIYVVKNKEMLKKLAGVCKCTFGAPVIMVIGYDKTRDWKSKLMPGYTSGETDTAIVCTHMMLEAWEQGIGSCWVGYFNAAVISETLSLPENIRVTALLPMGYPADDAAPLDLHGKFRDIGDVVSYIE